MRTSERGRGGDGGAKHFRSATSLACLFGKTITEGYKEIFAQISNQCAGMGYLIELGGDGAARRCVAGAPGPPRTPALPAPRDFSLPVAGSRRIEKRRAGPKREPLERLLEGGVDLHPGRERGDWPARSQISNGRPSFLEAEVLQVQWAAARRQSWWCSCGLAGLKGGPWSGMPH